MDIKSILLPEQETFKERKNVVKKILKAGSKVMNEMGFARSKMKDIAKEAGVTEPTIYQYFKGKEDLLFSIVESQVEDSLLYLYEQIQGITGAYNILRKVLWAYLRYNDTNRDYISLVLLECRANRNFYQSNTYKLFRRYSGLVLCIIQEGISEGVFRSDINPPLVRDIILGVLDFEAYTVLVIREIKEAAPDFEHLMRLLDPILLQPLNVVDDKVEKRQAIIKAALRLFVEKGFAGATISDIAGFAGVSDSAIYECFKNKEDILLSIPEDRFARHLCQLEEIFNVKNKSRKLRRFIRDHFRLYLDDHNFLIIYLLMIQLNRRFTKSRAFNSWRSYIKVFEELVQEGMDEGSFSAECNIRVFRNLFLGAFTHMSLRWFIVSEHEKVDKFKEISGLTDLLLDSVEVKK
ncbi:TetR/AcrR family transcriptional regulator [bacterium]|nr:TetR/AcrR family transcriptional regulator [bacterium]